MEVVGAPQTSDLDVSTLEKRVTARIESEDIPVGDESDGFGAIEAIRFRRPREYPSWLIATTTISIPYGSDTSLYLFEPEGGSWKLRLSKESNGYSGIRGAQGWLQYYVAPDGSGKKPFLVTADITPATMSVWQTLRLNVLRPGPKPESPLVLVKRALDYCLDEGYYFSMRPDGSGLIYLGFPVDEELAGYRGIHYLDYAVKGNRASRIKESAIDPSNEVRKWIAQNWSIASQSLDPLAPSSIREWHDRFQKENWRCGPDSIHLGQRPEGGQTLLLASLPCRQGRLDRPDAYILFAARQYGFRIASISKSQPISEENSGFEIYNAGTDGLTDPIGARMVQPKLPPGVRATPGATIQLPLQIVVNEDGSVSSVNVTQWPASDEAIVVPAIRAVRTWRFKPGMKDGKAVKVSIPVTVVFQQ